MTVSGRFTDELTRVLLDITELVGPQAPRQYRRNLVWERLSSTQWHGFLGGPAYAAQLCQGA